MKEIILHKKGINLLKIFERNKKGLTYEQLDKNYNVEPYELPLLVVQKLISIKNVGNKTYLYKITRRGKKFLKSMER